MIITFKLKLKRLIPEIFFPIIAIAILLYIPITYEIDNFLTKNFTFESLFVILFTLLLLYFTIFRNWLIIMNYYKYDKNKTIIIDTDNETFEVINGNDKEIIHFSNIYLIYKYYNTGITILTYYKLILKTPTESGKESIIFTFLLVPNLKKYIKNIEYRQKSLFNLFIPNKKNHT